jgi:hypothetical protein
MPDVEFYSNEAEAARFSPGANRSAEAQAILFLTGSGLYLPALFF